MLTTYHVQLFYMLLYLLYFALAHVRKKDLCAFICEASCDTNMICLPQDRGRHGVYGLHRHVLEFLQGHSRCCHHPQWHCCLLHRDLLRIH